MYNREQFGVSNRTARALRTGLAAAAMLLGSTSTAAAESPTPIGPAGHGALTACDRPSVSPQLSRAARHIDRRIMARQRVTADVGHTVFWSPNKHSRYKYQCSTTAPIREEINNREFYFGLVQGGDSLSSLQVVPIPADTPSAFLGSPLTYTPQPGEQWHQTGIEPSRTTITLDATKQPTGIAHYTTGQTVYSVIGATTQIDANSLPPF